MNLRIPNLFKNIKSKLFKKEVQDVKSAEEKKAEQVKNLRITHGGNGSKTHAKYYRRKIRKRRENAKELMQKANFGTFSPVKYF